MSHRISVRSFSSMFSVPLRSQNATNFLRNCQRMTSLNSRQPQPLSLLRRESSSSSQLIKGPLDGVTVLDLTRVLAGPVCTQLLGDMGAEIIKVENPKGGDDSRSWGPPFNKYGESAYFLACNRNKKSVAINIKHPDGLLLVKKLAKQCDVIVENFVPGKMETLGLSYEELKEINPRLIYGSVTGFGIDGPLKHKSGYDVMASAMGGLMDITGYDKPTKVGVAVTDIATGLYLHGAIIAALYARHRTGLGQRLDISLLETQVASLANIGQNHLVDGRTGTKWGTAHESIVPYQAWKTADGYLVAGALNDRQYQSLCKALGKDGEALAAEPKYRTNPQRVSHRVELVERLEPLFAKHPNRYWIKLLDEAAVPCAPVNTLPEVFREPQVLARDMVLEVDHAIEGKLKLLGFPVKYSGTPMSVRQPPPFLGQHTLKILTERLNLSSSEIEKLSSTGVIAQHKTLK